MRREVFGRGPRRVAAGVLAPLMAACLLAPVAQAQEQSDTKAVAVLDLLNHARIRAGMSPLARSPELANAAQAHSVDMAQHSYLDHTGLDGSEPQDRAERAGYHVPPNSPWIVVEVISAISADPRGPVNWWLSDALHRRVVLNPRWREVGVGYSDGGEYGNYWTVDVGCRPGVLPTVLVDGELFALEEACGDPSVAG